MKIRNLYYARKTGLKWQFIAAVLVSLIMLLPVSSFAQVNVPLEVMNELINTGTARIIIGLDVEVQPEGGLDGPSEVTDQRERISQVQNQFLSELNDGLAETNGADGLDGLDEGLDSVDASSVAAEKKFTTIPYLVIDVDSSSLMHVRDNSLVSGIELDALEAPSLDDSIPLIKADFAWAKGYLGSGQAVAVLDTGVDKTHPALSGKVISEACYSSTTKNALGLTIASTLCPNGADEQVGNGAGVNCSGISSCSHGTHVAGIVAANGSDVKGVAKGAQIIAIQVFSRFTSASICGTAPCVLSYVSDQVAALERILELHNSGTNIAAVNMSLGGGKSSTVCDTDSRKAIIDNLRSKGIATVTSSGNNGYTDAIGKPACISSAISVGATTKSDGVASYSNSDNLIDLLAPGSAITSTVPGGTGSKNGTSMAAPHVAGAFAVLKSAAPDATVDQILSVLKDTGVSVRDTRNDITKPRINLEAALVSMLGNILVNPTTFNFGDIYVDNSSSPKKFTVTNNGSGFVDLKISSVSLTGTDHSEFRIQNNTCSGDLASGKNCTFEVVFSPESEGAKNASVSISSNDPDTPTLNVPLKGNGEASMYSLTVRKSGIGTGRVISNHAGITCGDDCSESYNSGTPITLTATSDSGSVFTSWSGGGCSGNGTCQTIMNAAKTVTATFTKSIEPHTITATASSGGNISPLGNVNVNHGADQEFTIRPNNCYSIANVTIDGISYGALSSYEFKNVVADYKIAATFTANSYPITATAGTGGSISPSGNVSVKCGADQRYTITPNSGYRISEVLINGSSIGAFTSYTFRNVTRYQRIEAKFVRDSNCSLTPTIESVRSGRWDNQNTWNPRRIPNSGDTVLIQPGHVITGPYRTIYIYGLCNHGQLWSNSGRTLYVLANKFVDNYGHIRGRNGSPGRAGSSVIVYVRNGSVRNYNDAVIWAGNGGFSGWSRWWWWGRWWGWNRWNNGGQGGSVTVRSGFVYNRGVIRAGNGGGSRWGCPGNGGNLNIASRNVSSSGGQLIAGRRGWGSRWRCGRWWWSRLRVDPNIISLSGAGTKVEGEDVVLFGGKDFVLDLTDMDADAISADANITLAVGEGGIIDLRGSEGTILNTTGEVRILSDNIMLDEGVELEDIIEADNIVTGPAQIIYDVSVSGPAQVVGEPSTTVSLSLVVANGGPESDTYTLSVVDSAGWSLGTLPSTVTVESFEASDLTLDVTLPSNAGDMNTITVTATSQADSDTASEAVITVVAGQPDEETEGEVPDDGAIFDDVPEGTGDDAEDTDGDDMIDGWETTYGLNPNANDASEDSDNDGASNIEEFQNGTDPSNSDTDGDAMPDGWEMDNGLNPVIDDASEDMDNDTLSNFEEYQNGTDPADANDPGSDSDTDDDGVEDEQDAFPNDPTEWLDSDGDGVGNNADADDDNDGMPDEWEAQYNGLKPLVNDASEDLDQDGWSNLSEYENGYDPTDYDDPDPIDRPHPGFETGKFTVGETGEVKADYLYDGGLYEGELGIFSLSGMESLEPNSPEFIEEAAGRALSESEKGCIVVSDRTQGARFSGQLGSSSEPDRNKGDYIGLKECKMVPGDTFATILVPNSTMQTLYNNPGTATSYIRPIFSLASANPEHKMYFGQIAKISDGDEEFQNAIVYEDMLLSASSDRDYNDLIVHFTGVTVHAPTLDNPELNLAEDWRPEGLGSDVVEHIEVSPPDPDTKWITITLKSPADLMVYDPEGRVIGKEGGQIPGATFEFDENGHQIVSLPALDEGDYRIVLRAIGDGGLCHLEIRGFQGDSELVSREEPFVIGPHEVFTTEVSASSFTEGGTIRFEVPKANLECDFNGDSVCDDSDIEKVSSFWNTCEGERDYDPFFDFDDDGCITILDIMRVVNGR